MGKMVDCAKVNPATGCGHVMRAESEEDLLRLVAKHAREDHGLEPTPQLMAQVKQHIQNT